MNRESGTLVLIRLRVLPDMAVVKIEGAVSPALQSRIVCAVHAQCDIWSGIAFGKRDDIRPAAGILSLAPWGAIHIKST